MLFKIISIMILISVGLLKIVWGPDKRLKLGGLSPPSRKILAHAPCFALQ